jgi:adenine-specific DNA-methyltransferase
MRARRSRGSASIRPSQRSTFRTVLPLDTILLGDCRALLADLPADSVDLVVSSPPYNLGKEYEARQALDLYLEEQSEVLTECVRVLKDTGSLFWQVGAFSDKGALIPLDVRFFPMLEDLGLIPRNRIIWARQHGLHARQKFSCRHETILWFTKSDTYTFNLDPIRVPQKYPDKKSYRESNRGELSSHPEGKNPGDLWVFRNVKHNHEERTIHPCQFPEDLIARIVLATTGEGGVVLDPYMGVGTAAVVARDHGRHYLGAETDPTYHAIAVRRIEGVPDEAGSFPNLKTLRDYVARTGEPIEMFRFDVQVGKRATPREQSRIFGEEHHREAFETRLIEEESAFAAKRRGEPIPELKTTVRYNGNGSAAPSSAADPEPKLFEPESLDATPT